MEFTLDKLIIAIIKFLIKITILWYVGKCPYSQETQPEAFRSEG